MRYSNIFAYSIFRLLDMLTGLKKRLNLAGLIFWWPSSKNCLKTLIKIFCCIFGFNPKILHFLCKNIFIILAKHQSLQSHISTVTIDTIEAETRELMRRVLLSSSNASHQNGYHQNGTINPSNVNPDLTASFPHLNQLVKNLARLKNDLSFKWDSRKVELDQCSQLKLFEQDAENLSKWIHTQFTQLSNRMVTIGGTEIESSRLLKDHLDFADSVNVSFHLINLLYL